MSPAPVAIRAAAERDAEAIARIYNQGIEDRLATLETEPRSSEERRSWLAARGARHPVVVADADGTVVGWGSLNPFDPRPVYDEVADFSAYIAREHRGEGVGRALLTHLIELARTLGYRKLVLAALPQNEAGLALYTRMGFEHVGTYREQGTLDGRLTDVVLMERVFARGRS